MRNSVGDSAATAYLFVSLAFQLTRGDSVYRVQLPMQELDLARLLSLGPTTYLEFATPGDPKTGILPQLWAYGPERDALYERLKTDPDVETVSQQTVCNDRIQYSIRWGAHLTGDLAHLVQTIHAHDAIVLFGRADQTFWRCLLRFPGMPSTTPGFPTERSSPAKTSLLDFYVDCELDLLEIEHYSPHQAHAFLTGEERPSPPPH